MNKDLDYSKIAVYYFIGTLFQKGIAFLTVPIFTRIMGTDDYGLISTYNSWLTIISMLISAALYMSLRLAFVDYKDEVDDFLASITTFAILDGAVFCLGAVFVWFLTGSRLYFILALVCVFQATGGAIMADVTQYNMMQYRYRMRTALMIVPSLLSVIFSIITILLLKENKYLGRIFPTALVNTAFGIVLAVIIYRKCTVPVKKEHIIYGLKISAPLILHGIALNILSSSDRIMITSIRNSSETGIYSLIYNVGMLATAITTSLDGIWSPWFIRKMDKRISGRSTQFDAESAVNTENAEINAAFKAYLQAMTIVMIAIILVGPEIVKILADKRYWEGIPIIPPIVLANYMIFVYTFYVGIEHFYKKTVFISVNTIIAAGVNVLLNALLIPRYGYVAAAYTTLAAYIVSLILHMIRSYRLDRELFCGKDIIAPLMLIVIAVAVFYAAADAFVIRWLIALCCMAYLAVKYRDKIRGYIKR